MSGPLNLTAAQLHTLGGALNAMTEITKQFGVSFTPYSRLELGLDDNVLKVSWDGTAYVIDDRNGD
ncbi:hypothetical protein [Streptomyces sp. NPDC091215]|uniref:hypothetical protein n=1 Tax=Streptomyces sp. NPDC091215 TaxID=3155192 RepID=UPI0034165D48